MNTKKYIGIFASAVFALSVVSMPANAACTFQTLNECSQTELMSLVSSIMGSTTTTTTTSTTTASFGSLPAGFQFTKNLKLGTRDDEVKSLQIFLNSDADTLVAASGAGSAGNETTYFGNATKAAVMKFQTKYGITPVAGYWGSISRAKANTLVGSGSSSTSTTCASGAAFDPVTGQACATSTIPGCLPGYAFSATTGQACTGTTVVTTGTLSAAVASDNPGVSTLITGQSIADLAHFTLTNGSTEEVKITSLELQRLGVSADATLANVYLFDGATRLTDAGTVSSGKVTFNATNGVIVIPANTSKVISVKADILAGSNGQTVGIALSGITSSAQLSAILPLNGNIHSIANANLATVAFGNVLGTNLLPGNTTSDPMDNVVVWQNTVTIGNRNVIFNKISLKQINSVEAKDLTNFRLVVDGTEIATLASLDSNGYLTFSGLNKTLTTGNRVIKVIANLLGGSGRIAQFSVRNKADVEFKDSEYSALVAATNVPATAGTITINPGVLSVTKSSTSVSGKVANNGSNVSLAKYEFKAYGEPVKVETLTAGFAYVDAGGVVVNAAATIRNGKIYVNGAQVGSTTTIAAGGTQFTTNFVVTPGTTAVVEIYGDVFDNDGTGSFENNDTLTFSLLLGASNATKQVSYGTINVPTANTPANQVTVAEGTLTVGKTSAYANQNVVVPQTLYKVGSWDISGSATENVNVNTLGIDITQTGNSGDGLGDFDEDDIKDAYLKITVAGGTAQDLTIKPTMAATNNNWPVSITLEKNQTMKVELWARILGTAAENTDALRSDLDVAASGSDSGAAINVNNTNGQVLTVQAGNLLITRAATSPVSVIVDDSGNAITASYKFEAQNDAYVIEEVLVNIANVTAVSSVNLKDGSTIVKTMPAAAAIVFGGLNISVNANESKVLDIELVLTTVGAGAGTTGAALTTNIQGAAAVSARSGSTGISATINTAAVPAGNAIYAHKAYPTVTGIALDTNGEKLVAGDRTLLKFSVTSNGGAISWNKVIVNVTKTAANTIADGARLVDSSTGTSLVALAVGDSDCEDNTIATCTMTIVLPTEEAVSGTKTYELKGTVGGALALNSYIAPQISSAAVAKGNAGASDTYATIAGVGTNHFVWSDASAQGHSLLTSDWTNEFLVKTFPVSQTLTVK